MAKNPKNRNAYELVGFAMLAEEDAVGTIYDIETTIVNYAFEQKVYERNQDNDLRVFLEEVMSKCAIAELRARVVERILNEADTELMPSDD